MDTNPDRPATGPPTRPDLPPVVPDLGSGRGQVAARFVAALLTGAAPCPLRELHQGQPATGPYPSRFVTGRFLALINSDSDRRFLASSHGGQVAAGRSVLAGSPLTASAPCPPAVFADRRPDVTDDC